MKKNKKGIYSASNVTFDANKIEAYSYHWWRFVTVHKGFVVFNTYPYSPTTQRHQSKVRSVMRSLGIQIDIEVETRLSLDSNEGYALLEQVLGQEQPKYIYKVEGVVQ